MKDFSESFKEFVNDMNNIAREAKHMGVRVNNKFMSNLVQEYNELITDRIDDNKVMLDMLDLMDILYDSLQNDMERNEYRVVYSLYDRAKEFYFGE